MPIERRSLDADSPPLADIPYATAAQLAGAYRSHHVSPVEVASVLLDRLDRLNGAVNAFVFVDRAATLAMARRSEERWFEGRPSSALDGVPVSIKDLVAVAGWPLVRGSRALQGSPAPAEDAPAAARLREAGCVFLGKTATSEAGSKIVTRSPAHGVTLNPFDLARTPGGSSGGAAVALALGIGPLALGSDGAGSIRIPAAWTGVFGIKPSFGRVPTFPPSVFMPHSVLGPMARDVRSATALLDILARSDRRDPFALTMAFDTARALDASVADLRIGVTADFGIPGPPAEAAIRASVESAAHTLQRAGAIVSPVQPTWPCDPFDPFMIFWEATYAGFLANLYTAEQVSRMDPDLQAIAERGRAVDMVRYHQALLQRLALTARSRQLFQDFDLLLGPVMPCAPPPVATDAPEGWQPGDWRWCPYTYLWNMTGQPAASVPWTQDSQGLPIGVQLVGDVGGEPDLLRAAAILESAAPPLRPAAFLRAAGDALIP